METDILIAGGGIAGLCAAARLAGAGWQVTLVDPAPPGPGEDLRTTAYLQPAVATLMAAGVWPAMEAAGAPLRIMRLVDAGGQTRAVRETADFDSAVTGHSLFGWNVPNRAARAALGARLAELNAVTLCHGTMVTGAVARDRDSVVRLADGRQIAARLVVAADGRNSTLREAAGIGVRRWDHGQQGLVFAVTHDAPHDGVSTEIHRTGGPCTLVPMPDHDGRPCSSVVWMMPRARAAEMAALDDAALGAALTGETMGLYGPLTLAGPRAVWPIITQAALTMTGHRLALMAEAAHVVPPIGAQGLNMSLGDIETLTGLLEGAADPGAAGILARYNRRQHPRMLARIAGVEVLNRAAMAQAQPLRDLRMQGLRALSRIPALRRTAVRLGMGG